MHSQLNETHPAIAAQDGTGAWHPIIVSDVTAHDAWQAVDDIARWLVTATDLETWPYRSGAVWEASLLFGYNALVRGTDGPWVEDTERLLNNAIDQAREIRLPGLYAGLCGLGWTLEHLARALTVGEVLSVPDMESPDLSEEITLATIRRLEQGQELEEYDLISGLAGFGRYFLDQLPRAHSVRGIRLVVDHLESLAIWSEDGVSWLTPPELISSEIRADYPRGYYNLGVAHGIPGVLHFLSEVESADVDPRAGELLDAAMRWFIKRRRAPESVTWFGSVWDGIVDGPERAIKSDPRMAWCHGDLGIASVLLQVARRHRRHEWDTFAHGLLDHCLERALNQAGVQDGPLCHGAAGVAHIFNRIFQTEGDLRCRDAALLWFDRLLQFRHPGTGAGGFSALRFPQSGPEWEVSPAFLDGSVGIGLALLAGLTNIEPAWDRLILASGLT